MIAKETIFRWTDSLHNKTFLGIHFAKDWYVLYMKNSETDIKRESNIFNKGQRNCRHFWNEEVNGQYIHSNVFKKARKTTGECVGKKPLWSFGTSIHFSDIMKVSIKLLKWLKSDLHIFQQYHLWVDIQRIESHLITEFPSHQASSLYYHGNSLLIVKNIIITTLIRPYLMLNITLRKKLLS